MTGINTKYRSDAPEMMDDFTLEGDQLKDALDKIASINNLLGGNQLTLQGVLQLIANLPLEREITILDVGCGNGDMLRSLADYAVAKKRNFKLIGMDANQYTVTYARRLSEKYPNISYVCEDIFSNSAADLPCDIVLCTLTLHHFKDTEILKLLNIFRKKASTGIVINDLQRSIIAYWLFKGLSNILGMNSMTVNDGLVSILRGFKKHELARYSELLEFKKYKIRWKWAFCYQWIISTI